MDTCWKSLGGFAVCKILRNPRLPARSLSDEDDHRRFTKPKMRGLIGSKPPLKPKLLTARFRPSSFN